MASRGRDGATPRSSKAAGRGGPLGLASRLAACELLHQREAVTLVAAAEEVEVVELVVELIERAPGLAARVRARVTRRIRVM